MLAQYGWPGNVRELRNVVERAMLLVEGTRSRLRISGCSKRPPPPGMTSISRPGGVNLEAVERSLVAQALKRSGGNQTKAATLLGLNRDQIRYRIEKFGLSAAP